MDSEDETDKESTYGGGNDSDFQVENLNNSESGLFSFVFIYNLCQIYDVSNFAKAKIYICTSGFAPSCHLRSGRGSQLLLPIFNFSLKKKI